MKAGRSLYALLLCSLAGLLLLTAGSASAASVRVGRVPRLPPGARPAGALPDQTRIRLTLALSPRDPAALAAYAHDVSTPGSPVYHQYLSVDQFAQRFGPTAVQIAAVHASLRARGLSPGPASASGLAIPVSPTAAQATRAFAIGLERYTLAGGRSAFANTRAPALDPGVAKLVQGVIGLNTLAVPKPLGLRRQSPSDVPRSAASSPSVVTGGPQPCSDAQGVSGAFTADQLASAYGFSSLYGQGDLGAGQTVALYELEKFSASDINQYQSCYSTSASVTNVNVDGGPVEPPPPSGEAALDIEDVIGLAPKADVLVYSGPNTNRGAFDTFAAIIGQNRAKVVSTSWGLCEADTGSNFADAENTLFQEAATQGQSIVAATGDDGAEACMASNTPTDGRAVSDPAAQPLVTAVGGTSLNSLGPPPSETVWNTVNVGSGATGGGISEFWTMPSYQSSAPASLRVIAQDSSGVVCGSTSFCREIPDVSADADPFTGYAIFFDGSWGGIGGTSASAPLWGALLALTNASPACAGTPVGFANPVLYRVAGSAFASTFTDVTSGDNVFTGVGGFSARAGFDMSTGLGTPNGATLPRALCDRVTLANPGNQASLAGTAASLRLTASSSTGAAVSLRTSGLPAGLSFDPATAAVSGTLASPGTSTVTVLARDTNGAIGTTSFQWSVRPATVTLEQPGDQHGTAGKRLTLKLSASVDNGRAPSYSATGLPAGLSVDRQAGIVSGVPSRAGRFAATATAADASGASDSSKFTWTIGHALRSSRTALTGVAKRSPKLSFTLTTLDRGAIRTISVSLPAGLSFAGHARGLTLTGSHGTHVKFKASIERGVLMLKLSRAVSSVRVVASAPAIHAGAALARKVAAKHAGSLELAVTAADAQRLATRLTLRIRPA